MKKVYKLSILISLFFLLHVLQSNGQYVTTKVKSKHQAYTDSLKNVEYNYILPILGQGAYSKGFDIPYPVGIMGNYFWSKQDILIDNLQLGYKGPNTSFDLRPVVDESGEEILGFGHNFNESYSINVRPDFWIFPFLNVYGIFGTGRSHTEVNIDRLGNKEFNMKSVVDQGITTAGFGILVAGGVGPVWISGDFNFTWNKPELTDNATRVNVMGIRMGHTFVFKNRPERNIAAWVGTMGIQMQSDTYGSLTMREAIPDETWDRKDQIVADYRDWYDNEATPAQKIIADKTLTPIINGLDARNGESIVKYGIDKQVKDRWNMLLGAQFQLNKHWMLRSEVGFLGSRTSYLLSLNYRLLGIKKKSS
ncbi:MAG: hypothetical protein B6D61_06665 [Bacteroidetes bacterium 4484_249]|nr:MAG: hypothetical protein B6D61_06665 [Bacteroidetes bacterium 4484_249]